MGPVPTSCYTAGLRESFSTLINAAYRRIEARFEERMRFQRSPTMRAVTSLRCLTGTNTIAVAPRRGAVRPSVWKPSRTTYRRQHRYTVVLVLYNRVCSENVYSAQPGRIRGLLDVQV